MRLPVRIALAAAAAAALGVTGWAVADRPRPAAAPPPVATTTAAVTRGDVVARVPIAGTLGFDGAYTVVDQLPAAVLTTAAGPGTVLVRGQVLFTVAATQAVLLYGALPAWRDFAGGMSDGDDVAQLESNLVALGMDPRHEITVDRRFTPATGAAIRRWQTARGLPAARRTGTLSLGEVVFLPGAIRVRSLEHSTGEPVGPGTAVQQATATARVVTANLSTDRQALVHAGDRVEVTVPGIGQPVPGTVRQVGTVATPPEQGNGPATVPVIVTVTLPPGSPVLDQAPVQVGITSSVRRGVLMVPVTALLAAPAGGYQVAALDNGNRRLVDVRPGLYDDSAGTVEITAIGARSEDMLSEGTIVEVPAR